MLWSSLSITHKPEFTRHRVSASQRLVFGMIYGIKISEVNRLRMLEGKILIILKILLILSKTTNASVASEIVGNGMGPSQLSRRRGSRHSRVKASRYGRLTLTSHRLYRWCLTAPNFQLPARRCAQGRIGDAGHLRQALRTRRSRPAECFRARPPFFGQTDFLLQLRS